VAQDIGHLFEARTLVEHLGGGGMPKDMTRNAGAYDKVSMLEGLPYYPPDRAVSQRLKRGPAAQKDLTTITPRAPTLEVGHDGLTDILREG
jgi:hypothetical protein